MIGAALSCWILLLRGYDSCDSGNVVGISFIIKFPILNEYKDDILD